MTDHKPVRGLVRNPFPRKFTRNMHGSRRAGDLPAMDGSPAKRPQIVHQSSFAPSLKAVPQSMSLTDENESDTAYTTISSYGHPGPAVYDISEVPDTNIYAFNGLHTDYTIESSKSQIHSKPGKVKPTNLLPESPQAYFLPPAVPLSPFPSFDKNSDPSSQPPSLSDGSDSPVFDRPTTPKYILANAPPLQGDQHKANQIPQHIGWDDFRSSRGSLNVTRDAGPSSLDTPWPKSDKQVPPPAPHNKLGEKAAREEKDKRWLASSVPQKKKARKQSDMETLMRVHKFGKKLQVVYHQGPKGEGQKMWNGIRGKQREKRELKPTQAPLKAPWATNSSRTQAVRTEAQKEQLNDLHAAALDMPAPKAPLISPPRQFRPKPTVPVRPAPLGIVRSPVIHKPLPGSVQMKLRGTMGSQGKVSNASTYTYDSWDVPVTASRSVQYDAQESIIDYSKIEARVPILDPAPKPRTVHKKGLPPRPVLAPGEREPPELAEQERMYKLRVGTSSSQSRVDLLPPAPQFPVGPMLSSTASKSQNHLPTGNVLAVSHQIPYVATAAHNNFAFLDDRQTQRPRNKEPKHRFAEKISSFFDAPSHSRAKHPKEAFADLWTHQKDKARAKHQEKVKEQISAPRPVLAPNGSTANFSIAAGGVGGPAAAVAVAPQVPNPAFAQGQGKLPVSSTKQNDVWDTIHDAGRRAPRIPPPVTLLPKDYVFPREDSTADLHAQGKAKKEKKANWAVPFSRSRRDSDASMVCADARQISLEHSQQTSGKGKQRRESGVLNMMIFKGPVRQHPPGQGKESKVRDPGPSRSVEKWQYEDESLVPEPLGIRKSEATGTDASFYRKYDSLFREYEDRSLWF